jgi:siroheme synthase-like protein
MSFYYPIFLDLNGKRSVVVGGGRVAEGKIEKLRGTGSDITVISPEVTPALLRSAEDGAVRWLQRDYQPGDLEGAFIAIAATNRREVNQRIFEEAERLGVLLNVVDDPPRCSFIAPSVVQRGAVTLAISTGGASPALARKLRESLANSVELEWADLAAVMSQARRRIKEIGAPVDPQHWQCCLTPELLELVQAGREQEALEFLVGLLLDQHSNDRCPGIPRGLPAGVID